MNVSCYIISCACLGFVFALPPRLDVSGPLTFQVIGKRSDTSEAYLNNKAANVSILTTKDIFEKQPAGVPELLKSESGLCLSYMGIGQKYTLMANGYSSKPTTLVLVDGVRQNDGNNDEVFWESIPISNVERIDVIRGGSSAIYGQGAVGGVINISTISKTQRNLLYADSGSFGAQKKGFSLSDMVGPVRTQVLYEDQNGKTYRENSDYNSTKKQLHLTCEPIIGLVLDGSLKSAEASNRLPGPLTYNQFVNTPEKSKTGYDQNSVYKESADDQRLQVSSRLGPIALSGAAFQRKRRQISRNDTEWFLGTANMQRSGTIFQAELPYEIAGIKQTSIFGLENSDELINNETFDFWAFPPAPNPTTVLTSKTNSIYLSHQVFGSDFFILDAGMRWDKIRYDYTNIYLYYDTNTWSSVYGSGSREFEGNSPAIGLTILPDNPINFFLNANRSFKVMPMEDFAVFSPSYNANPSVNPQVNDSLELGMNWGYNETLSLKVSGYSSWIQDEILYQDEFYKNNNFNTKHQGWAIQLRSKPIENLDLRFSYNKDFGELLSSSPTGSTMKVGNQIANIPEYVAMLSATYTASRQLGITLLGRMQGSSTPINDFSGVAKRVDAFTVWDVIATYQFGTVNLYGKVENLFDKLYPAYSAYGVNSSNQTYYPGNRQTVSVGVKVDF